MVHVVKARGVNDAWPKLIELVQSEGKWTETRNGRALVVPVPVATVYSNPTERVLLDPVRDANPFLSCFEPLWMLAGRDDAPWLDRFVSDFSARFAEEGGRMHGAYGKRWRDWFQETRVSGDIDPNDKLDQLDECVRLLRANPQDRQAVIQMWDPSADLGVPGLADRPCNQQILLRADRLMSDVEGAPFFNSIKNLNGGTRYLDITVTNRSNDLSWGLITANACQFSTLQEYLAARIGVQVGTYTQFSNNLHLYESAMDKVDLESALRTVHESAWKTPEGNVVSYPGTRRLVDDPETFDADLRTFMADPEADHSGLKNSYFQRVAQPAWLANEARRRKDWDSALGAARCIEAPDWRTATVEWIERRIK